MRERILSSVTVALIVSVIFAAIYSSVQWHSIESLKREVEPTFEAFRHSVNSGESEVAFGFMTPTYKDTVTLEQFAENFPGISQLHDGWTVRREGENRYRICCAHPGASFAPGSTMTYLVERNGDAFLFTGERQMWLD